MNEYKINTTPFLNENNINRNSQSHFQKWIKLVFPKIFLYKFIIKIIIFFITILLVTKLIKVNNTNNFLFKMNTLSEDEIKLFEIIGFGENSKELVYSKIEKWGFNKDDIADKELNLNFDEEKGKVDEKYLYYFKYSKNTYKNILLSNYDIYDNTLKKNILLFKFIEYLKKKEIITFYDFLNYFLKLQDLNCLPENAKGIYINNQFFIINNSKVKSIDINEQHTLINESPFLYLTSHGGKIKNSINNICKFSRDGYFMGSVLLPFEEDGKFFNIYALRGLLLHEKILYVPDSYKYNSKVFTFSDTLDDFFNRREFLSTFIKRDEINNPLMIHPYDIKLNGEYIYLSNQNTSSLLRYFIKTGELGQPSEHMKKYNYLGLMVKLIKNEEIRGIDFDEYNKCYVANKQRGVEVYDENFNLIKTIPVIFPISVVYDSSLNHILVGSSTSHDIKEYDIHNFELIKVIKHPLLKHVAGIVLYKDSLFAVSQMKNKVLEFSLSTSLLKTNVIDGLSDIGERLIISDK